jgi:hypothetical protein
MLRAVSVAHLNRKWYPLIDHQACVAGDWALVRDQLLKMGRSEGGVSQGLRELQEFYELPDDTLWVTMADGHFWWAFASGWSSASLSGEPLNARQLSSALTRTASYQMTICAIKHAEYLLRRIRCETNPLHAQAIAVGDEMRDIGLRMIRQLDWRDFETLVDLIFARGGLAACQRAWKAAAGRGPDPHATDNRRDSMGADQVEDHPGGAQ